MKVCSLAATVGACGCAIPAPAVPYPSRGPLPPAVKAAAALDTPWRTCGSLPAPQAAAVLAPALHLELNNPASAAHAPPVAHCSGAGLRSAPPPPTMRRAQVSSRCCCCLFGSMRACCFAATDLSLSCTAQITDAAGNSSAGRERVARSNKSGKGRMAEQAWCTLCTPPAQRHLPLSREPAATGAAALLRRLHCLACSIICSAEGVAGGCGESATAACDSVHNNTTADQEGHHQAETSTAQHSTAQRSAPTSPPQLTVRTGGGTLGVGTPYPMASLMGGTTRGIARPTPPMIQLHTMMG